MHEALKQHNVLTFITGSSSMTHWCTCRNLIPRCIIAKQQRDYSHHIEHLHFWHQRTLLVKTSLQGGERREAGMRGVRASWMVGILYFQWKITHFNVCCLSLSQCQCCFSQGFMCFFWGGGNCCDCYFSSSLAVSTLAFSFSTKRHICKFFVR